MTDTVIIVAGGDLIVVFDDADRANIQYHVMVGANLDTDTYTLTEDRWNQAQAQLHADGENITIVDARGSSQTPVT